MTTTAATTTGKAQLDDSQIKALADAKLLLVAKVKRLQAMQVRAKAAGNSKLVADIAAELKEADGYRAQIASIEATVQPFMDAYSRARLWVSDFFSNTLGELGAIWIPVAAAGAITAVIYAINTWDRKTETSLQRYEAELKAHDEWVKRGKSATEATALVQTTAKQYSAEQEAKAASPGVLSELTGIFKLGAVGLLAFGAWKVWQSSQKSNGRA